VSPIFHGSAIAILRGFRKPANCFSLEPLQFRAAGLEVIEIHTIYISIANVALSYHASIDAVPIYEVVRDTKQDYIAHRRGKYKGVAVN
jgi:hypothetical protein